MSTDLEPKKEKEGRCSREQNGPFLALCILAESVASESWNSGLDGTRLLQPYSDPLWSTLGVWNRLEWTEPIRAGWKEGVRTMWGLIAGRVNTCSPLLPSLLVLVQDQKALVCAKIWTVPVNPFKSLSGGWGDSGGGSVGEVFLHKYEELNPDSEHPCKSWVPWAVASPGLGR